MLRSRLLRQNGESGQVLVITGVTLIVLLGMSAFVIDVGRGYLAKRQLQASADAAALAGAQALPNVSAAAAQAQAYGDKNHPGNLPPVTTTVTTKCITGSPCTPVNTLVVQQSVVVPTAFAKVLGLDHWTISAKSTAMMGQGVPKPAHIAIVMDRTGSMTSACTAGGTKLQCVQNGVKAFLGGMDPTYDKVALLVFPPSTGNACTFQPKTTDGPNTDYDLYPNGYLVVGLSNDYKTSPTSGLNPTSTLVNTIGCIKAGGTTATATAIDRAEQTLAVGHSPDAQDVIIFLTDGEANFGPCTDTNNDNVCENNTSPYRAQPCQQAVNSANTSAASGTVIYGIAYNASGLVCSGWKSTGTGSDGQSCNKRKGFQFRCNEVPSMTAHDMVLGIASDSSKFFDQPSPADLTTTFKTIAQQLTGPTLVDDNYSG